MENLKIKELINPGNLYLTDGGLETTLIFHNNIDLPHFASFTLLDSIENRSHLIEYYKKYLKVSEDNNLGFVLETPTWRANKDWGYLLGYNENELERINKESVLLMRSIGEEFSVPTIVSGNIGPRGDGYTVDSKMDVAESQNYHNYQISSFKEGGADLVTFLTANYIDEAAGVALAAKQCDIPVVISFTVETDGKLPSGETLESAINTIDQMTEEYPLYYMINCAHTSHFMDVIKANSDEPWIGKIKGVRANASCKSHAELDESTELDIGDKHELSNHYLELFDILPELRVFGGCCGTDESHIESIINKINEVEVDV